MDTIFPFGFPTATAFYLVLFVLSLVAHVLFMNYVLAGTAWLAWSVVTGRLRLGSVSSDLATDRPVTAESILADWIPAMLSGAITAGVAPLLFLQILYQREFYTANLLLFNRWMSILPVLIVGFYTLYVLRSHWLLKRGRVARTLVGLLPFFCVSFVAYSWTENHLLSISDPDKWRDFYVQDKQVYFELQIAPRLAVWALGSIPTMCVWLAWQIRYRIQHNTPVETATLLVLPNLALFGLCAAIAGAIAYYLSAPERAVDMLGSMARLYLIIAIVGLVAQFVGWYRIKRCASERQQIDFWPLMLSSAGLVATILGMSVCREVTRIHALGEARWTELLPRHAEAMQVEGFWVFLLFVVINAGLIAWCFWLVKRNFVAEE